MGLPLWRVLQFLQVKTELSGVPIGAVFAGAGNGSAPRRRGRKLGHFPIFSPFDGVIDGLPAQRQTDTIQIPGLSLQAAVLLFQRPGPLFIIIAGLGLPGILLAQILIILLTVLVEDNMPYVLFMDEPEVSLHLEWQKRLVDLCLELNPNVQIILTTHSPAIVMNGWVDSVTEVSDITV